MAVGQAFFGRWATVVYIAVVLFFRFEQAQERDYDSSDSGSRHT